MPIGCLRGVQHAIRRPRPSEVSLTFRPILEFASLRLCRSCVITAQMTCQIHYDSRTPPPNVGRDPARSTFRRFIIGVFDRPSTSTSADSFAKQARAGLLLVPQRGMRTTSANNLQACRTRQKADFLSTGLRVLASGTHSLVAGNRRAT